ncbi:MAG: BamA/TamA family outer membrane protein [Acidobacteria bacterium]|nr:BamA/TamA family outer membrane protein [Acidobacteriota bacterium]
MSLTSDTTKTMAIAIDPGARATERGIAIDTGDRAMDDELEQWVRGEGLEDTAWREPDTLERALAAELRTRGYVSPTIAVGAPRVAGRTALLDVAVDPGPRRTLQDVSFIGADGVDAGILREAAGLLQAAWYDPSAVDQARDRLGRIYRREGFLDARVAADTALDADGLHVAVLFRIEEGPRQVLREVVVRGNRAIATNVITRAIDADVGTPLGADEWLRVRSRLFDTALFRRVDVSVEPLEDPREDDGERPMRLLVIVEEWPALRLRYGFQVSEEHPEGEVEGRDLTPGLSADVTRRTLFGRAIVVGAAAEYRRRERLGRAFVNAPTLGGLPIESVFSVERSRMDFADASFVTDRLGVAWEQRIRPAPALHFSYSYRFDRDHTFETAGMDDPLAPPFDMTIDIARLTAAAVFDTRDDPIDTTRGWLLSSNFEYAPAALGSAITFVRHLGQAYHFRPFHRIVFASAARFGVAAPFGGQTLISSERFFGGGARTVRGVDENVLGPRDVFGDAAGGRALVVVNQEVRFPIFGWVRGIGFIDAGNVFETAADLDLGNLVGSVGAGVRIATPFALLRADVARLLWSPESVQRSTRWTFGIGHAF